PTPTPTATPAPTATPKPAPTKAFPGLLPRVAQILGIDEQKLRDAFAQAKREQHLALIDKWIERQIEELIARETDRAYVIQQLDKAVQEGRITAEQKAQILERWEKGGKQAPRPFGKQGRIQKR
ncbi:MAG: hypothetical protein Q8O76_09440, partial [Chloroflexota bacterium]|nr:hypothetical protein [Chloroflexota bacterium]